LGAPGSEDFGEEDEEEDRKPSVQYLDSLNDYRKRSRSKEDEGAAGKKLAKATDACYTNGGVVVASELDMKMPNGEEARQEDTIVYGPFALLAALTAAVLIEIMVVNGVPMEFSKVTEEDQELMTPEEYTAYFEVIQAQT
jgi:transcription initiation factor TFIIE subunit alpha